MSETAIRGIARYLYQKNTDHGLPDTPEENWKNAEIIFHNKLKYAWWWIVYSWWLLWKFLHKHHYPIVALVAILSLFANAVMMKWNIDKSATSTDLNTRPYLSINMEQPRYLVQGQDTAYGNDIVLKNTGKIPAGRVSTSYYITTELDKENRHGQQWFDRFLGGFGGVSFVAPQATELEKGFRSLSPSAEYYYWEGLVTYEGIGKPKIYWTHVRKVYFINRPANQFISVSTYGEWDRNEVFVPPRISTTEEVMALLEELKRKRKTS